MIYTRLDVNRVLSEAEREISKMEYEFMLANTIATILTPFEGKIINKRMEEPVKRVLESKGFWVSYWDGDRTNLELRIKHRDQQYKDTMEFVLGRKDQNDRRFSLEAFKNYQGNYFDAQAKADKLKERLKSVPEQVEKWNNALDTLANIEGSFGYGEWYLKSIFSLNYR